jgi:hypothetical protein
MIVRLTDLGCRRRLVHRPSVFVSGSSGLLEQVKGWRRFMVADAWARVPSDLRGRGASLRQKENPGVHGSPGVRPETEGRR